MHVGLVAQEFPPRVPMGGIGTQTALKALELHRLGHTITVITRADRGGRTVTVEDGVRVVRIDTAGAPAHTEIADWIQHSTRVAAEIDTLHADTPFDILDFPEWAAEGYTFFLNRTQWNRIPAVIQLHGPLVMLAREIGWPALDSEFYRTGTHMESTCLRLADGIYSSSNCSTAWCGREYGIATAAIPTLHTGIQVGLFQADARRRGEPATVVFAGKLVRNKGVFELVEAAVALAQRAVAARLILIGTGTADIVRELGAIAAQGPLDIQFAGFLPRAEIARIFSVADIFCAPSHYEGGPGFVYLEAMASGLPVVACTGSGAGECVTDGREGLLVPPADTAALTAALHTLLGDADMRERMSANAVEYARRHADSAVCVARIEQFYRQVLDRAAS